MTPATLFQAGSISKPALDAVLGEYAASAPVPITIKVSLEGGRLFVDSEFTPKGEAVLTAPDSLMLLESGAVIGIERNRTGQVTGLSAGPFRTVRKP